MKIDVVPSLAVLQLCPFFDVMIGPINGERQLLHVVGIGPMLRSLCTCNTSRFGFAAAPHLCFIRTHLCLTRSCYIFIVGEVLCSQPRYRRFETAL